MVEAIPLGLAQRAMPFRVLSVRSSSVSVHRRVVKQ